jgi:CHAD domain-containing protein
MAPKRSPRRADFVRASIAPAVETLVRADPHLRLDDDAERFHVARVATRKLRCDLRVFGSLLETTWATDIRDGLKRLGGLLGAVRDADVLNERVRALAMRRPPERDTGATRAIATYLRSARKTAYAMLQLELSATWYLSLVRALAVAARDGAPLAVPNCRLRSNAVIAEAMRPAWKALKKAVRRGRCGTDVIALHRIRIRAKRLRYISEVMGPLVPRRHRRAYARFLRRISRLQEYLGELHDIYLDRNALRAIPGVDPLVAHEIIELEAAVAADAQHAWRSTWAKISRRRLHFWR